MIKEMILRLWLYTLSISALLILDGLSIHAEPPFLRISLESEPVNLDWNAMRSPSERFILSFLMRGLFRYDSSGQPVCDLCQSHSISADQKTHHFTLKETKWSDGKKLIAQHFADSFQRLRDPKKNFPLRSEFEVIQDLKVKSPMSLEIVLNRPSGHLTHLLTLASLYPIRKELIGNDHGVQMAQQAVLGPYFLAAWEKGKRIVLEGNPEYFTERPVYRVSFILGEHEDLLKKFKAGRLDIFSGPTTEEVMGHPGGQIQVSPFWGTRSLIFNVRRSPLQNRALRRAILFALDRNELPAVMRNGERLAAGMIPPGITGHRDQALTPFDLTMAREERNRAVKLPKWIELKILFKESSTEKRLFEWLQGRLEKVHIRLKAQSESAPKYYELLEKGQFDLAFHTWSFKTASPIDLMKNFQTKNPLNLGGWTHVGYDALFNQLLRENAGETTNLVDRMARILELQEVALIPLGHPIHSFLLGRRVSSFAMTPFGDPDLVRIQMGLE